jgi:thiamine transport system permease protein
MAPRTFQITTGAAVAAFVLFPLWAVWRHSDALASLGEAEWAALWFTLKQALLSAFLSVFFALPLARALARTQFWGRQFVIMVLGAPFILPVIVAILGLIAVFGQNGIFNLLWTAFGFERISIYGLQGVLLAHVFFNLPLATRMLLLGWTSIPSERIRLAQSLGLTARGRFCCVEWPMLVQVVPSAFAVIFVICLSSFAVALTLGGGPRATTIELAIYQAIRFEFDFATAAMLGFMQLTVSLLAALIAVFLGMTNGFGFGLDRSLPCVARPAFEQFWDGMIITIAILFLALPLAILTITGAAGLLELPPSVWAAALRSVLIALGAGVLCLMLALPLCTRIGEVIGTLGIAVSPLVLGTGIFLIVRPYVNPFDIALIVTLCVNAVLSLPFVLRVLRPNVEQTSKTYLKLSQSLGLGPWAQFRWVFWPRLRRPLGFSAGLVTALSMGDLGVIALFGDAEYATLPLKIYQLMGSYRMEQAASGAVLLLSLSLSLFWIFDRWGRGDAAH